MIAFLIGSRSEGLIVLVSRLFLHTVYTVFRFCRAGKGLDTFLGLVAFVIALVLVVKSFTGSSDSVISLH